MALCGLWSLRPSRARQRTAQPRRWAPGNSGRGVRLGVFLSSLVSEMQARPGHPGVPCCRGLGTWCSGHLGWHSDSLPRGWGAVFHRPLPRLLVMGSSPWPSASSSISLIKAGPAFTPSAQSAPGPKPVTRLGWVGQGLGPRAKGAGLGHPLLWERVPSSQHGPGQRPPCPLGPRLWEGRFEDLMGCPPPAIHTLSHHPSLSFLLGDQEPSQAWREQRRLSSASASGQWSPTSDWVRVGQMQ